MLIFDIEVAPNYLLLSFLNTTTGGVRHYEMLDDVIIPRKDGSKPQGYIREVKKILRSHPSCGFNSLKYDLPIIAGFLNGYDNKRLYKMSYSLIEDRIPHWQLLDNLGLESPECKLHVDLIEVAPGKASLKLYGARLHTPTIQDLPFDPDHRVEIGELEVLKKYCENDLELTHFLYDALLPQLRLRAEMGKKHDLNLLSSSDAQIAERYLTHLIGKRVNLPYKSQVVKSNSRIREAQYNAPKYLQFNTPYLNELLNKVNGYDFTVKDNGSIEKPDFLSKRVKIDGDEELSYQLGIGGVHSTEKKRTVIPQDGWKLFEVDVASYYPNIILNHELFPKTFGEEFLSVYKKVVDTRLKAKREGDKTKNESLKIVINGSFGKFGNRYSRLYSPHLFLQVTMSGQFSLLMLAERMVEQGHKVISANTDGLYVMTQDEEAMMKVCKGWEELTNFPLEATEYVLLASRDVNNYVAIDKDGGVKGKGVFASSLLAKNPDERIVYEAVIGHLMGRSSIEEVIKGCDDVRQFLVARRVTGGANFKGEYLGKVVRYYKSALVSEEECLTYTTNGNKVPRSSGCKPLMTLPEKLPNDIDYPYYIERAYSLLKDVGSGVERCEKAE